MSENVVFISNAINQLRSTTEMAKSSGLDIKNKTISLDIERADKTVQDSLVLRKNEDVVKFLLEKYENARNIKINIDLNYDSVHGVRAIRIYPWHNDTECAFIAKIKKI